MDFYKIKSSVSIVDVVRSYGITLKKVGKQYSSLSPFKRETKPSFFVLPEKNIFKCFSSGYGGDVIKFVALMENISYAEAARILSERYNIPLDDTKKYKHDRTQFKKQVANYLSGKLVNAANTEEYLYLKKRFSFIETEALNNIIKNFKIGLWNKHVHQELVTLYGEKRIKYLSFPKTDNNSFIVLPIIENHKVITFMFRTIHEDAEYKYIYSAEPDKSLIDVVYNHNIHDRNSEIYVTEGIFDAIALYSIGIKNVVSLLGLNISSKKLSKLNKYTVINMVLDTDRSGYKASLKAAQYFMLQNKVVYLLLNTPYKDVDEAIKANVYNKETISTKKQLITTHIYTRRYRTMESEIQYKQWIKKVINSISDKDVRYLYNRSIYEVLKQWKREDVNSFDLKQLLLSLTTSSLKLALSYIVDVIDERERYNMLQHASSDKTEDEINKYIIDLIFYGLGFSQCS